MPKAQVNGGVQPNHLAHKQCKLKTVENVFGKEMNSYFKVVVWII